MSRKNLLHEQRITELEKKLQQMGHELNFCKKEKDEFIYLVSHDLKAPVRKMITFIERLVRQAGNELNKDAVSSIERIQKNILSMQSLIDDLSVFSETEASVHLDKCDLNNLINEVLEEFEPRLKKNAVAIHLSGLPTINCKPSQLKIVFEKIIDNAIKFQQKEHSAAITISSDLLKQEEKIKFNLPPEIVYYEIRFADNGIGFNEEDATQILKPLVRLHGQSSYPGNGLGLAICDKIIKLHRGIFYAQGIENRGSVFVLILPEFLQ
jgi:signal transduction histidine kinase